MYSPSIYKSHVHRDLEHLAKIEIIDSYDHRISSFNRWFVWGAECSCYWRVWKSVKAFS